MTFQVSKTATLSLQKVKYNHSLILSIETKGSIDSSLEWEERGAAICTCPGLSMTTD